MPVKLLKPHTHAGRKYPVGATLSTLRPDQQEWLVGIGVGERTPAVPATKSAAKAKE
ncbi:MAG TPA: hypothetical protein PLN31_09590 [Azoarcus taiwanensis]|nr:hypothetical protein [Azoarcus taiwanensis]